MAENLPANMQEARAANEAAAAKTPAQMNPTTTTVGASNSQFPVEFGNSLPGLVNKTAAGVQNTAPTITAPTAEQFAQQNANQTTIGDQFANGVRDKNVIGSFQNNGDNGTGGTSMTTTGTGTVAKPENINTPTPTGTEAPQPTTPPPTDTNQPSPTPTSLPIVNDIAATAENASAIVSAARSFGTQLNDFTKSFSGSMKDFMDNQTNAYTSLSNDMRTLMETSIGAQKTMTEQYVTNLNKLSESMVSQQNASIAAAQKNADALTQFALDDKKLALAQNDIASKQSASNYANQIEMAQDNQSRYLGYLTGQFAAAGMTGGSAALQLTGKYLAAGQMAINALGQEAQTTALMYITKGTQIMSESAKQLWQIEAQRIDATNKLQSETTDKLLSIENNKFSASSKQLSDSYTAIKDYNNSRIEIQSKSFNELMQVHNASMDEAKFAYQKTQDLIQQDQWTKSFERSGEQFNKTFGLQEKQENRAEDAQRTAETGNLYINGKDTGLRALVGKTFDQNVKEFERQGEQWNKTFNRGVFESDRGFKQSTDQFSKTFSNTTLQQQFDRDKVIADATGDYSILDKYNTTPKSVSGSKYGATITNNGELTLNLPKNANGEYKTLPGREQCGAFVNDVLGLTGSNRMGDSIAQKKSLITSAVPITGGAFVQELSGKFAAYGHTGVVTKAYPDGSFDYVNANANGKGNGSVTSGHMTADQARSRGIVGFTSGNTGGASAKKQDTSQAQSIASDMMSPYSQLTLKDVPEKLRSQVSQALTAMKQEAIKTGDMNAIVRSSAGGKSIDASTLQKLTQAQNVDSQLNELEKTIGKEFTDPIVGIIRSNNSYDTKAQEIKAKLKSIVPQLARGVYGEVGVLTDADIENYSKTLPNIQSTAELNKILTSATRSLVTKSIQNTLSTAARAGYDVSGFSDLAQMNSSNDTSFNTQTVGVRNAKGEIKYFPSDTDFSNLPAGYSLVK